MRIEFSKRPKKNSSRSKEVSITKIPRLNGVIRALEQGKQAFAAFSDAEIDSALAFSVSNYDRIIFE
jgi:hypothetical protein